MCGIAGFVDTSTPELKEIPARQRLLESMCDVITHRGPDDTGMGLFGSAALGMRRLSIIDISGGHQPISGCHGSGISIVFNGEIYNFRELQNELSARGHRFRTRSDTEAIVHAYEEFGPACLEHLRGMFALAIWDENRQRLFVARDRVGKKPLYYAMPRPGTLVFGSELKSLLQFPGLERKINLKALDAYLALGYVPDPLSILEGVYKLEPAHYLLFEKDEVHISRYWDFQYDEPDYELTESRVIADLQALIDEAVRIRLVSDVPLGAFLSGGVDSSTVVGFMARNMNQPVKTFSIGFREDSYDELKYARMAAQHYSTDHHEFVVTPDICQVVDQLVWHLDEPFADSSAIPTFMVSKMAREFVTVVLSGDGGDELFAGYTRYVVDKKRRGFQRVPRFIREGVIGPVSAALPHGTLGRNYLHNISLGTTARYTDSVSVFTALGRRALYSAGFSSALDNSGGVLASMNELAAKVKTGEELDRLLYIDSKTYLPGDILTKVDRMSMAASLEARVPLLDHKLIEYVTRIPAGMKMLGLDTKHIFKRAVRGLVPDAILDRPKQGFGVPIQQWINDELKEYIRDVVTDSRTVSRGYFEGKYIEMLFEEHRRSRRDHSMQIWSLFMFELWNRAFIDESGLPTSAYAGATRVAEPSVAVVAQ
jgi:asparagine synthase (glutamine-hydrolysing)